MLNLMRENQRREPGGSDKIPGAFLRDGQGFGRLDVGSRAGVTNPRPPPP